MDYAHIYERFIQSRRRLEVQLTAYAERHHVIPKVLGGSDAADNLIRLTPEDHFFAHLLLAKIHGGRLWAPLAFMVGGSRKDYRPTESRKKYGWVKRALAKSLSGSNGYQFDHRKHELIHRDGRSWSGLQSDLAHIGLSASLGNMLLKGRIKTAKGWYLASGPTPSWQLGKSHPMYRGEVHDFVNVDGREFMGTQFDFHVSCGVSKPAASMLARGKVKVWNGWHLRGSELPKVGRASRWLRQEQNETLLGRKSI